MFCYLLVSTRAVVIEFGWVYDVFCGCLSVWVVVGLSLICAHLWFVVGVRVFGWLSFECYLSLVGFCLVWGWLLVAFGVCLV